MQPPTVANQFFELLEKSKLLSAAQIEKAVSVLELDRSASAEKTARKFVQRRLLTPFQAERLLEGRYRGFVIDGFRVREVLGVGGMGCVYIAEHPDYDTKVAVKVLASQHALDAGMLTRLKLEAKAGQLIDHPNVIRTYEQGSTGAVHYMVMELVRGISLHEYVALNGPMKWGSASDVFAQIAAGLYSAHRKQIIHRDIKPANILLAADGGAKLLDFGLARMNESEGDEFSLAMIFGHDCLGTPDYIAPEQAKDSNQIDQTADIYSLGCTFYVALTGRVPFPQKTTTEKLAAHQTKQARPIGELRRDVPDGILTIIEKMMAKKPEDRFQSAKDVALALKSFCRRRPIEFDFRQLVTLRARQARDKDNASARKTRASNSSITSASAWLNNPSHHMQAELDTLAAEETPPVRQIQSAPSVPRRPAPKRSSTSGSGKMNVPTGWYLKPLGGGRNTAVTRVKTRVGSDAHCEFQIGSDNVDSRQCYIEFKNGRWTLHQESRRKPTFVNGKSATAKALKHGARITFADGEGFEFLNKTQVQKDSVRKRRLLVALGVISAVAAAFAAWNYFS